MSMPLYLLHAQPDAYLLAGWAARHQARHRQQAADLGDALHGLLRAAFGTAPPQPFRLMDERRGLLAYTALDPEAMRARVAAADPLAARTLGLTTTDGQPAYRLRAFPSRWSQGQTLRFEVRVRPTVRTAAGERDVFLQAVERAQGGPVQRDAVYVQWLREHLDGQEGQAREPWQGAAALLADTRLVSFSRQPVVRRGRSEAGDGRRSRAIDGPDAVLGGHLRIRSPEAFAHLLARGVGRHRAFGFGMLLLSPPERS